MSVNRMDRIQIALEHFLSQHERGEGVSLTDFLARAEYADLRPELDRVLVEIWAPQLPVLEGFDVYQKLGDGKFGSVWLARDQATCQLLALKIVRQIGHADVDRHGVVHALNCLSEADREFFAVPRKAPRTSQDRAGLFYYYETECADGEFGPLDPDKPDNRPLTLEWQIRNRKRFNPIEVLAIGERLAKGIAILHEKGRRHFDIKPPNILIVGGRCKIADVGLMASFDRVEERRYTPGYYFPLDAEAPNSPRHDIYAIGKVLFQMGIPQNLWVKKLGLCPRPQDFQGMAPVSKGVG